MTTILRNVEFEIEVLSFADPNTPVTTAAILCALHDRLKSQGATYLRSDEAKALLHSVNMAIHGVYYEINGLEEHARLCSIFHA